MWWTVLEAVVYIAGLYVLFRALSWLAESRALRGQRGTPMGDSVQRGIRIVFFFCMFAPVMYLLPLSIPLLLLYLITYCDLSEIRGGRPSPWFQNLSFWHWLAAHLELQLVSEAEGKIQKGKPYILGLHPHGILPLGGILNVVSPINHFAKRHGNALTLRGLAASFCFFVPGYRDFCLAGGVCDAARYSAKKLLDDGFSIFVVPGGATEALYSFPDEDVVYIKKRKGFVKLALQHGADLIPVFSFNENNQYDQFDPKNGVVKKIRSGFQAVFGISLPLLKNLIPRRCKITTVVGAPIAVEKMADPTDKQVQDLLDLYTAELEALWHRHSEYNLPKNKTLKVI